MALWKETHSYRIGGDQSSLPQALGLYHSCAEGVLQRQLSRPTVDLSEPVDEYRHIRNTNRQWPLPQNWIISISLEASQNYKNSRG